MSLSQVMDCAEIDEQPRAFCYRLASYMSDVGAIRSASLARFGAAPPRDWIANKISEHQARKAWQPKRHFSSGFDPAEGWSDTLRKMRQDVDRRAAQRAAAHDAEMERAARDAIEIASAHPNPFLRRHELAAAIIASVAASFGTPVDVFIGPRRHRELAYQRSIAARLLFEFGRHSYPMIGRKMGNRDHSTIMHSVKGTFPVAVQFEPYAGVYAAHKQLMDNALAAIAAGCWNAA